MGNLTALLMEGVTLPFKVARYMVKGHWRRLFVYVMVKSPLRNSLKDLDGFKDLNLENAASLFDVSDH